MGCDERDGIFARLCGRSLRHALTPFVSIIFMSCPGLGLCEPTSYRTSMTHCTPHHRSDMTEGEYLCRVLAEDIGNKLTADPKGIIPLPYLQRYI